MPHFTTTTPKHDPKPVYSGEPSYSTLVQWLNWWDSHFANVIGLPLTETKKTQLASVHLKGSALVWYRSLNEAFNATPLWSNLKRALTVMFIASPGFDYEATNRPISSGVNQVQQQHLQAFPLNHYSHHRSVSSTSDPESLPDVHQDGSLAEYTERFTSALAAAPTMNEDALIIKYVAGLDVDLRRSVALRGPKTLSEAFAAAADVEQLLYCSDQHQISHDMISALFNSSAGTPPPTIPTASTTPMSTVGSSFYYGGSTAGKLMGSMPSAAPGTLFVPGTLEHQQALATDMNLHKLTPEERERLRKEGGCFRCRQLGHQKDQCPLLAMGNNVVPPPNVMGFVQQQQQQQNAVDQNLSNIPKLTAEERDRLRKFGGCYRCRRLGHQKENCPMNLTHPHMIHDSDSSDEFDPVNF